MMKVTKLLAGACAVLATTAAAYAQTTYQFGEGQAKLQGNGAAAAPAPAQPAMNDAPQQAAAPAAPHKAAKNKKKHHKKHHARRTPAQDTYAHH
jgi:hypothetical protein